MTDLKEKRKREEFQTRLGKHIRAIRKRKGISGAELGRRCFMDKPNISRIENGKVNISVFILKKICEALEIEFAELFKGFDL